MTERQDPHPADESVGEHGKPADHGDDGGHGDDAHDGAEALGPLDIQAWAAAVVGIALGLVVAAAFMLGAA